MIDDENEVVTNEEVDNEEENAFLKTLEELDHEVNGNEELTEEEQRQKNKNAEEARKRREAEEKAKKEAEEKAKLETEEKEKETLKKQSQSETEEEARKQVVELTTKYPDIDLAVLDKDEEFQDYISNRWYKGGETITQLWEGFVKFKSKILKQDAEKTAVEYRKKSTPNLKGKGGNGFGTTNGGSNDIFSQEELEKLSSKIPTMNDREYSQIEEKLNRSINYYRKK